MIHKPTLPIHRAFRGNALILPAAAIPLLAWLAPLGFAPLFALTGLLCLPAWRRPVADRRLLALLCAGAAWAAISEIWTPFRAARLEQDTALELVLSIPLAWACICAARGASAQARTRALDTLSWGLAALGAILLFESFTNAFLYRSLTQLMHAPMRIDLAERNVSRATYGLILFSPISAAHLIRGRRLWLLIPTLAGALFAAHVGRHAPLLAIIAAPPIAFAAYRWPRMLPRALGGITCALFASMPLLILAARGSGHYEQLRSALPESWSTRLLFWEHATDAIASHPLRGWGLGASRAIHPSVGLHPHNGALQIWLELGLPGVVVAAAAWWLILSRRSRNTASVANAACVTVTTTYLVFQTISFGIWQAWFIGMGCLAATFCDLLLQEEMSAAPSAAVSEVCAEPSLVG